MGISDSGEFMSHAITGGVCGGAAAAVWSALGSAVSGRSWWAPLALHSTRLWGLSPHPIVAAGLAGAVTAGVTWMLGVGLATGALFGLVAGALLPEAVRPPALLALGALLGFVVFSVGDAAGLGLLGPAAAAELPTWVQAVALILIGACAGRGAGRGLRA